MIGIQKSQGLESAISASWQRCEQKHKLLRDTQRPIMRLQSTEVTPRLEEMVERTGGRQGVFRQLAEAVVRAGQCMIVTDVDGILVRLESRDAGKQGVDWNGIALGSVWDERVAGTNGVSMAMSEGRAFTVRGEQHFFSKLSPFACTAVPLLDADNQKVGAVNISVIDRGNPADYMFASQLLGAASERVQRILFERKFAENQIISLSPPGHGDLLRNNELVAINEEGKILGSTANAHLLLGLDAPSHLAGRSFDAVFGADAAALDRVPERMVSVRSDNGPLLNLKTRVQTRKSYSSHVPSTAPTNPPPKPLRRRLAPSFQELATGSETMAALCTRADALFQRALPFVIEGESGTGKSALVAAILETAGLASDRVVTVDCASLGSDTEDRSYFRTLVEQARVIGSLSASDQGLSTLVFDNIDEMPDHAQAGLRNLLNDIEQGGIAAGTAHQSTNLRVIGIARNPLRSSVEDGSFREDLYYLLASATLVVPPLRSRERPEAIVQALAARLSDAETEITAETMGALAAHDWPGNLRELRNVLQQALMEGNGQRISLVDLRATQIRLDGPSRRNKQSLALDRPHRALYDERSMLLDALTSTRWNVSQAARNLGIGRATINRKIKQYGLSRPS
ncbi:sigma-54-dependent Fis family transcriptional regulator [Ruegeria sp. HKCCD8929]|uniref:sigma-54-dependent Fis family transcriptional regulator n=1 Tax=Ruegeria sp. HKCCD8929 TaxID=2683006 RepID=UPI001487BD81|nr:sigma 54-interacting transcriptional regulator [Ruegeria sp. HKCCD8929]